MCVAWLTCCIRLQDWFADNEFWLVPYAAFCFLRDLFGTAEHWRWGTMSKPTPEVCCYAVLCLPQCAAPLMPLLQSLLVAKAVGLWWECVRGSGVHAAAVKAGSVFDNMLYISANGNTVASHTALRQLLCTSHHVQVLAHITSPEREWHRSILCCYWVQYQLHRQLKQVRVQDIKPCLLPFQRSPARQPVLKTLPQGGGCHHV